MILSVDSSAVTASVALTDGKKVIKSEFINAGLTHSETLLPMIKRVMGEYKISDLDAIAVTAGPGSFTGVRIGVATVKGLAFNDNIPCISVSTLEAIACNFLDEDCIVCSVMDARRMQFYNALFEIKNGNVVRLCKDRAISIDDLKNDLKKYEKVIIAGDGACLCYDNLGIDNIILAPEDKRYQCGQGVALAAENKEKISAAALMPVYLRLSQAERELKLKRKTRRINMIALGSDHAGFSLKEEIKKHLDETGVEYVDVGCYSPERFDYAISAQKACDKVVSGECTAAILCCGTGVGISMAANKVKGIRACCCSDYFSAKYTRLHNDANALCMGERVIGAGLAIELVDVFLNTEFEGGRHQNRVDQIMAIENGEKLY